MMTTPLEATYPESRFCGFSRCDGSVHFYSRVHALIAQMNGKVRILDVGCGRGLGAEDTSPYRRQLRDLRGVDREVIGIDVEDFSDNELLDSFALIDSPIGRWPIFDRWANLVVCDYVLEHIENPCHFFRELRRVLAPGGYYAIRTPNKWGYPAIIARCVPNRRHAALTPRQEHDVFPTVYRANTQRRIKQLAKQNGLTVSSYTIEGEPSYLTFSRPLYRLASLVHRLTPLSLRSTIVAYGVLRT
jgi:ubiquinone/menaquinone biosynthesis C-methylase UbiE